MTDNTIFSLGMAGGEALPAATIAATGIGRKTRLLTGHCGDIIAVNQSTMPARVLALSPSGTGFANREIARVDDAGITHGATLGKLLLIGGAKGVTILRRRSDGSYTHLGHSLPVPAVQFRLVNEPLPVASAKTSVDLSDADTAELVAKRLEADGELHINPGAVTNAITDAVMGTLLGTMREQATAHNRFWQPFMVRYALRLYNGMTIHASAPVLMTPMAGVPLVGVSNARIDRTLFTLSATSDLSMLPRCRLEMMIADSDTVHALSQLKEVVRGIDIAVSAPFYTFNQHSPVTGFRKGISVAGGALTGQRPGVAGNGGDTPTDTNRTLFVGQFAASSSEPVADQTITGIQLAALKVWNITGRSTAETTNEITGCGVFYHVATIALDKLASFTGSFATVPLDHNALATLTSRPVMSDSYRPLDRHASPAAMNVFNSRLNLVSRSTIHGAPPHIASLVPAFGHADSHHASVEVDLCKDGDIITVGRHTVLPADCIDPAFKWRWFCYPDADAVEARITVDRTWRVTLPLTPHSGVDCACFYSPVAVEWEEIDTQPLPNPGVTEVTRDSPNTLLTSEPDCPFLFLPQNMLSIPGTATVDMAPALNPMSDGQFGAYPLYLFTADAGIYVLDCSSEGIWTNMRQLTALCASGNVTHCHEGILFMCREGVMLLKGASATRLDTGIADSVPHTLAALPAIDRVAEAAGAPGVLQSALYPLRRHLAGAAVAYDSGHRLLVIYHPGESGFAHVFDFRCNRWAMMRQNRPWNSHLSSDHGLLTVADDGSLMRLAETDAPLPSLVITHLQEENTPRRFSGLRLRGLGNRAGRNLGSITIYGSNDGDTWFPVSSTAGEYAPPCSGTPWRHYLAAIITHRPTLHP